MVPLDPWVVSEKLITGLSQAFEDHPYHVITEVALVVVLVYFVFAPSYAPASKTKLSEKEVDQLVDEWEPEPLYHEIDQRTKDRLDRAPVIEELRGTHALVGDRDMVNMGSFNFLGFADNDQAKQVAVETLNKYGCGTCGPRGFYGTIDKHLDVEDQIARFLGVDEAILYSSGFSTIASAIPAFAKRGDIIVCDKGISFAVQTGVNLSRSKVYWFEHNDMADLEAVLRRVADNEGKSKKLVRKFIVTEGIFANYGDICPLPDLVALKNKYKYHLCLEESFSFGVLGETGRGVTEHFGVSIDELLFTCASVGNACASVGGFCAGSHRVIDHQRLSGVGYVFSASSPTLLVTFAGAVLQMLDDDPSVLKTLTDNTGRLFNRLNSIGAFEVSGDKASPVMHVTLAAEGAEREEEEDVLDAVVDAVAAAGYLVVRSAYVEREEAWIPRPSIRVTVSAGHTRAEIDGLADALADAAADL